MKVFSLVENFDTNFEKNCWLS